MEEQGWSAAGGAGPVAARRATAAAPRSGALLGQAFIVLSAFCYSTLGIFGKMALRERVALPSLLAVRFTVAAIVMWALVLASPRLRAEERRTRGRRGRLLFWGVGGYAVQATLFFSALRWLTASLAEVLLYTCPAWLALVLWARGRRPEAAVVTAIALSLGGTWLVASPGSAPVAPAGAALAILCGAWYAVFLLLLDWATPTVHPLVSTVWVITGAALAFDGVLPWTGFTPPATRAAWGAVAGLVAVPTILGFLFFVIGLRRVGPQSASVLSTFEPVGTLLLAALLLGDRLRLAQWAGTLLVLGAAFALAARTRGAAPAD